MKRCMLSLKKYCLFLIVMLTLLIGKLNAATITSNAVTGLWSATTSWSGGVVPTVNDNVIIVSGANISLSANLNQSGVVTINAGGTLSDGGFAFGIKNDLNPGMTVNGTFRVTINNGLNKNGGGNNPTVVVNNGGMVWLSTTAASTGVSNWAFNTGSIVKLDAAGNQTIDASFFGAGIDYLILGGSGAKLLGENTTVSQKLSMQGSATLNLNGRTLTYSTGSILEYSGWTGTTGSEWPATFSTATGGIEIVNASSVTLNANKAVSSIPLKVGGGSTLALSTSTLNAPTSLTLECGASGSTISGSGTLTLGGNVAVTKITGTGVGATISCPVALGATRTFDVAANGTASVADLTASGIISDNTVGITKTGAGILNLGSSTATLGGLTITAGTLTSTSGTLNLSGNFSNNGTFTHNSGTVNFNGSGAQSINNGVSSFNNIIIANTGGTCTATSTISVSGTFTTSASSTFDMGTNALSVSTVAHAGTLKTQNTGSTPITASKTWGGTVNFDASVAQTIPTTTSFSNLTLSGSGNKTFSVATPIAATLAIEGSAKADLLAGSNSTVNALALGGVEQPGGTWGSTTAGKTFQNDTYFSLTTGYVTVNLGCTVGSWTGRTSTDWNIASNWCGGTIPTATTNVTIPSSSINQPVIGAAGGLCRNITINSGATLTISSTAGLAVSGNWTNGGTFTAGSSTVTFNGTTAITGAGAGNFYNVTLSGSAAVTQDVAMTIGNNLVIGNGTTFTAGAFALTVTGTTTVGGGTNGTLTMSSATGTKTFTGAVTIANGGTLTENGNAAQLSFGSDVTVSSGGTLTESGAAVVGIAGSLTNNGTYTASTGVHTFSGAAKSLAGTISIPSLTISGTYTNNGTLTVTAALTGGTITQAEDVNSILNINFTSTIGSTLVATGIGNTVNYGFAGTQTVKDNAYYNLTLSNSGNKTILTAASAISGALSISGSAKALLSNGITTTANRLLLGGANQVIGTWGSTGSSATNRNDTWFVAANSGRVNVAVLQNTWTGALSTVWSIPGNWSSSTVPTAASQITIPGGLTNYPVIANGVVGNCKAIMDMGTGASISALGSGSLTITGGLLLTHGGTPYAYAIVDITGTGATISCPVVIPDQCYLKVTGGLTISGVISGPVNTGWIDKDGLGELILTGANTYAGQVWIEEGTLSINSIQNAGTASPLGTGGTPTIVLGWAGSGSAGTLKYTGPVGSSNRPIQLQTTGGTIEASGSGTLTLSGGITGTGFPITLTGTGNGIQSGIIATGAGGLLIKNGPGTWTLSGTNTYSGVTTINAGILSVATIGNGGVPGNLGQATNVAANLVLGGGTLQYTGATASTDRSFTLTGATTSTIDVTPNTLTISGASAATTGALAKSGTGTLILSGANTFSGAVTISGGILKLGAGSTTNASSPTGTTGAITVTSGAALDLAGFSYTATHTQAVSINGTGISSGGALMNSGGAATFSGLVTLGSPGSISTTGNITLGRGITGGFDLIKIGAGILNLGSSTATLGGLTITAGTLTSTSGTLNLSGNFSNNGTFTHNSGTVTFNGSGSQSIGGASNTFNNLVLSNSNTVTFSTNTIIVGNLSISSPTKANFSTLATHTAGTMTLGGSNVTNGTWGSTSSAAVFKNNTWFEPTIGYIKVGLTNPSAGTWTGVTSNNWNTGTNWVGNSAPSNSIDVVIPNFVTSPIISGYADCKNIDVQTGATLTIASGGSFIIAGTQTLNGAVSVQRNLPSGNWHLISSPVSGDNTNSFCIRNGVPGSGDYDLAPYVESTDSWGPYTTAPGVSMSPGSGYSVRRAGTVSFTGGTMNTGTIPVGITMTTILGVNNGWNCVGNPYTSAIDVNGFLTANGSQLDASYAKVYYWNQTDYTSTNAGTISVGQGFFVNSIAGVGTINFTPAQQTHAGDSFKSDQIPWPTIRLMVTSNDLHNETIVSFNEKMTLGLDRGLDGGKLKGNPDIAIYTRLIEDNGIDFETQALPGTGLESYRIPVGLDLPDGGNVSFTTKNLNLPLGAKVILEDTKTNTFTELTTNNDLYNTTVEAGKGGIGRFYLNTGNVISAVPEIPTNKFSVYIRNRMIYINGSFTPETEFSLYSMDGKKLMSRMAEGLQENVLDASGLPGGVYLLTISSKGKIQTEKLVLAN